MMNTRTFMAGLFRILTVAVFTAHIMLGCCIHHTHASAGEDCLLSSGGTAPNSQCPGNHGNGSDHSQHSSSDCQGVKCSIVSPRSQVGNPFVHFSQIFVAPLFQDLSSLTGIANEQQSFATGRLLLPIRLHLANQVLLI